MTQQISEVGVIRNVGKCYTRNLILVDDTSAPLIPSPSRYTIEIFNDSDYFLYYGGSDVTSSTGIPIFPHSGKVWSDFKPGFIVYLIRGSGESGYVRVVEYE